MVIINYLHLGLPSVIFPSGLTNKCTYFFFYHIPPFSLLELITVQIIKLLVAPIGSPLGSFEAC
jgi:hypothetical protein